MMTSEIISDLYGKYQSMVKQNVELVGEVEVALKWISYFIAGRGKETSSILSELAYSASNVFTLLNDSIIKKAANETKLEGSRREEDSEETKFLRLLNVDHLKFVLTLIEYLEVFVEITSNRLWGSKGRWFVIAVVQLCKTVLRLILFLRHKNKILCSPPVSPLTIVERKKMFQQLAMLDETQSPTKDETKDNDRKMQMTFTLKRSGRVIRTISSAPPVMGRTWKLPPRTYCNSNMGVHDVETPTELKQLQVVAEAMHTVRPFVHLMAMLSFGSASWTQWLLSLGMDVTSLKLMGDSKLLNLKERGEMRLRVIGLLYYLLRSPFYENLSKETLHKILEEVSSTVPLARFVCKPLLDYLPAWQRVYFYSWGS